MSISFDDKIIFFNFSEPVDVKKFFSACTDEDIIWNGGQSIPRYGAESTNKGLYIHHPSSKRAAENYTTVDLSTARLTRHSIAEIVPNYIQHSVLAIYYNMGIKTGDLFLDKPEAVRDIVRAFKNGEDVDAVVVKYLGDAIDYSNYSGDEVRQG